MRYHVGIGCSFGASDHNVHKRLAEKLDAHFINLSEPGQGNFRIYTELLYWSAVNQEKLNDTTFSIGWSGIYRNDMIEKHGNDKNAFEWTKWRADRDDPTNKHLPTTVDIRVDQTVRFLCHVLATQNLLKNLKCNYVMYNAMNLETRCPNVMIHNTESSKSCNLPEHLSDYIIDIDKETKGGGGFVVM